MMSPGFSRGSGLNKTQECSTVYRSACCHKNVTLDVSVCAALWSCRNILKRFCLFIIILLQLTFNIDDLETRAELALDAFCSNDHHKVVTIFTWMER